MTDAERFARIEELRWSIEAKIQQSEDITKKLRKDTEELHRLNVESMNNILLGGQTSAKKRKDA